MLHHAPPDLALRPHPTAAGPISFCSVLAVEYASGGKPARLPRLQVLLDLWATHAPSSHVPGLRADGGDVAAAVAVLVGTQSSDYMDDDDSPPSSVASSPSKSTMSPTRGRAVRGLAKTRRPLSLSDLLSSPDHGVTPSGRRRGQSNHRRQCGVPDCAKYALTGGFCIRHGGGKRCSAAGCQTVAQSGGRCKAHGGGSKCKAPACGSVARRRGYCMAHGGRQQCKVLGCGKCAHGGGFCISHGGGKRCAAATCAKSAQAGGFCYSHGGGKRCSAPECFQAARKGGLCIRHRKATAANGL